VFSDISCPLLKRVPSTSDNTHLISYCASRAAVIVGVLIADEGEGAASSGRVDDDGDKKLDMQRENKKIDWTILVKKSEVSCLQAFEKVRANE
jgi:hypothetical protein